MKKKYLAVAIVLAMSTVVTGCSASGMPTVKEMMVGESIYDRCVKECTYKGVEVDCTVTDEEVQERIDELIDEKTTTKKIKKGTCKKGDSVSIDFSGKIKGKKFDGGEGEDQPVTLGENAMFPDTNDFDNAIIGMKVGSKKTFTLKFPKNNTTNTSLSGKKATFTVKVNYISEDVVPKLNDSFVAKNTEYKTVAEYKEGTKQTLIKEKKDSAGTTAFNNVMETAKVEGMPAELTDKWTTYFQKGIEEAASQQGVEADMLVQMYYGVTKDEFVKTNAEGQAKQVILFNYIAKEEGLEVTEDEIQKSIDEMVEQNNTSEEGMRAQVEDGFYGSMTLEEYVELQLKSSKVVDFLKENAVIKDK